MSEPIDWELVSPVIHMRHGPDVESQREVLCPTAYIRKHLRSKREELATALVIDSFGTEHSDVATKWSYDMADQILTLLGAPMKGIS